MPLGSGSESSFYLHQYRQKASSRSHLPSPTGCRVAQLRPPIQPLGNMALRCWLEPHCRAHALPWKKGLWGVQIAGFLGLCRTMSPPMQCAKRCQVGFMSHGVQLLLITSLPVSMRPKFKCIQGEPTQQAFSQALPLFSQFHRYCLGASDQRRMV